MNDTDLGTDYSSYMSSLFIDVTWITCFAFVLGLWDIFSIFFFVSFTFLVCWVLCEKCDEKNYLFGEVDERCF